MKKKAPALQQVHQPLLQVLHPAQVEVELCRAEELDRRRGLTSERDEMWSYVTKKSPPRWLWHGIDHHTPCSRGTEYLARILETEFPDNRGLR
jgi:hypothetical protein